MSTTLDQIPTKPGVNGGKMKPEVQSSALELPEV